MQAAGCDCDFPYHSCVFLARDVIDTPLPVAIIQAIRHADGGRGFEQDGRIGLSAQRVEEIRAQMSFRCVCHAPPPPRARGGGGGGPPPPGPPPPRKRFRRRRRPAETERPIRSVGDGAGQLCFAGCMCARSHPRIVQFLGIAVGRPPHAPHEDHWLLVTELCDANLYSVLHGSRPLSWPLRLKVASDIAHGMQYHPPPHAVPPPHPWLHGGRRICLEGWLSIACPR
jgi:hypothetical protein